LFFFTAGRMFWPANKNCGEKAFKGFSPRICFKSPKLPPVGLSVVIPAAGAGVCRGRRPGRHCFGKQKNFPGICGPTVPGFGRQLRSFFFSNFLYYDNNLLPGKNP
jgi:hypothetical protein